MFENLVTINQLTHKFKWNRHAAIRALDDVSFEIRRGEIFGLVGESGSGKSTMARCIMNIHQPTAGRIIYNGIDTCDPVQFRRHKQMLQTKRQVIFQDSNASLNQRMKVGEIITEPLAIHHMKTARGSLREEAKYQLKYVGMEEGYLDQFPYELSGGQRQRIAIARALSMEPELLVADEPVASLDVSIQAQIINLFKHLQREHGFTLLFIAHDLAMVSYLCDRVGVMYRGKLVELAPAAALFQAPQHAYTKALLSAIPYPDPRRERARTITAYEPEENWQMGSLRECAPEHFVFQRQEEDQ